MIRLSLRTKSVLAALLPILTTLSIWSVGRSATTLPPATLITIAISIASVIGVAVGMLTFRATSERILRLIESAALVSAGVPIRSVETSYDELSQLALAMAEMSRQVIEKESELRDVNARLDAMFRATTGICILGENPGGKITFCNPGAEKMLGHHQAALVGRPLVSTVHQLAEMSSRPAMTEDLLLARGKALTSAQELETRYIRQDGLSVDVHVTIAPIRDVKGQTVGLLHVATDISARKVLESELRFKNDTLKTQTAEQYEMVEKASECLVGLDRSVLLPTLQLSESLKLLRDSLEKAEDLAVVDQCRTLSSRAEDGLRQILRAVPSRAEISTADKDVLPTLIGRTDTPLAKPQTTLAAIDDWYETKGELPSRHEKESQRPRILIVDDFEDTRALMRAYLNQMNCDLDFAGDGYQALEKIALNSYSLVLMDVEMPGLDGHQTAQRVRVWEREQGRAALPLVAITANTLSPDSRPAQWTSSLTKPFSKSLLLAELAKHVRIA